MMNIDFNSYATTEGCYVISDSYNIVVAFKCDESNPKTIDVDGKDIFVVYAEGDMSVLLGFVDEDNQPDKIIFERLEGKGIKVYDFNRLMNKIQKY